MQATFVRVDYDRGKLIDWAERTGLAPLSDKERDAAYERAHEFLYKNKDRLVEEHGWREIKPNDGKLFVLTSPPHNVTIFYSLPKTFTFLTNFIDSFFDGSDAQRQRPSRIDFDFDLVFTGPKPLCNIFYMLQCIAPGMFLLVCNDELEDGEIEEHARALPIESWVSNHEDILTTVLGSTEAYRDLLDAAKDNARSFRKFVGDEAHLGAHSNTCEDDSDWDYDGRDDDNWSYSDDHDGVGLDYTACSLECGYCGHCDYSDPNDAGY